jgi:gamma-glutamylcysteine synthetase
VLDERQLIGLSARRRLISLEPGGQFELSGAPLDAPCTKPAPS